MRLKSPCPIPASGSRKLRLAAAFFAVLGLASAASAQQAPQVLPFTMSTFAGPHAAYVAGAACANGIGVALDTQGDGCLANSVSIGTDPHDVRVDAKGNVFYIDDASVGLIHKINGQTGLQTIYAGSPSSSKACAGAVDTYGDGCPANDGAANNTSTNPFTSSKFKTQRGLGIAPNGDLFSAGYNDYNIHKISASTGLMTQIAGVTATTASVTVANTGPAVGTAIGSSRGVGVDAAGNVYIADTGANVIQEVTGGQIVLVTAANNAGTKVVTSGVPANTAMVSAPEDVQVDSNGNIIIADAGNNVVRAIYSGKGAFFGIVAPQAGYIYTIAGGGVNVYTQGGGVISTAVPGNSIVISLRKLAVDNQGNVYIADTTDGYIYFLDAQTGYIRLLVGNLGVTGGVAQGCDTTYNSFRVSDTVGDFCPGPKSELYGSSTTSIGVSADNLGNIYISDPEAGVPANSRIRKDLSGLNFTNSVALNSTGLQTIDLHFGPADTLGSINLATGDFTTGTPNCTVNADTTSDCTVSISFKPSKAGYQTAVLSVTSTLGGKSTFLVTATGNAANIALDPGALTATTTNVNKPQAVAYDGNGNTYVADTSNNKILRITSTGVVSTIAGTGAAGNSGDNGVATAATFNAPSGLAIGVNGVLFIADTGNNTIRQLNLLTGIVTTYAGGASTVCSAASSTLGDNCPATQAKLAAPKGLTVDKLGQLYVADSGNNLVRQISTAGYITTLAGGASTICTGATDTQGDGCAANAVIFSNPTSLAYDLVGNFIIVADTNNNIVRKIYLGSTITITTSPNIGAATINPLTLIAGNGQAGSTVSSSGSAINSQLNLPTGVAIDAAENVYIADTANHAVRLVSPAGIISTIVGIVGTSGATAPGVATDTLLNSPSAVTVLPNGQLYVADAGNNRILADARAATAYNFGRVSPNTPSSQAFNLISTGNTGAIFGSAVASLASGTGTGFAITSPSTGGCVAGTGTTPVTLAPGSGCSILATFTPPTTGNFSSLYNINAAEGPTFALSGVGAILTPTTPVLTQTSPATGNAQYGGSLTLSVTVTPTTCNTAAPSCFPTGTVRITVDSVTGSPIALNAASMASQTFTGLSVGSHSVTCSYSGDTYYAASSCGAVTITIAPATTTATLTATNNNQPQFTTAVLTATIKSSTIGIPTGSVTFYATAQGSTTATPLGTPNGSGSYAVPVNSSTGIATLTLQQIINPDGSQASNTTLAPGTYSLTCTYSPATGGTSNFAGSSCPAITFTVTASPQSISLVTLGCSYVSLQKGSTSGTQASACSTPTFVGVVPSVATADGSTTDATVFITPSNTVTGTLTFSCSGLPKYSICTFSPSSYPLTSSTGYVSPIPVDVTLWTDIKDAALISPVLPGHSGNGLQLASTTNRFGWPLALFGLAGLFLARRRFRTLRVLGAIMLLVGTSMVATGCAGVGNYTPNLTPAGSYPITIMVKSTSGASATTTVYFVVTSPGITGIQ